jgi:DNA-binding transcriptional LysR family regulator
MIAQKPDVGRVGRQLKLRDLSILMAVIECGTMGKAAKRLAVSQPVVSKAISDMEYAVGVRLLDRSQRGVAPTPYGRALVKRGRAIFDEMRQGLNDIEFLSDPTSGEVSVGVTASVATAIASPVIDRLSRQHPRMRFHVTVADSAPLFGALESRTVELAISRPPRRRSDEHLIEVLFHDGLAVITGAKNPLARRRSLALADLVDEPWLLFPRDSYFGALQEEVFRGCGLEPPRPAVEITSSHLRDDLLATQRFVTIVPGFSILLPHRRTDVRALAVNLPVAAEPVAIITLKDRSLSPAAQMFIEQVRELTKPLGKNR